MANLPARPISSARRPRKVQAEAAGAAQDRRQAGRAPRHSGQGDRRRRLRAGPAAARHAARPRGAAAALWRTGSRASTRPRSRRCRASSRWCATAASSASSPSARSRRSRRASTLAGVGEMAGADRRCPIRRKLYERPDGDADARTRSSARSRRRCRPAPRSSRRPTTGPTRRMPSIGPSCAVARIQGRQADGLDAQPGRLPAARHARQGARACRPPRSAASTWKVPAATATTAPTTSRSTPRCSRAPPDGRPVRLQWMRDDEFMWEPYRARHDHAGAAPRWPDGTHRRLELRRLEPEPQHAAGRSRRHQSAGELVSGRAAARPVRRGRPRSRPAPATATPSRSTTCRASASPIT